MSNSLFDELENQLSEQGAGAVFDKLATELAGEKKFH